VNIEQTTIDCFGVELGNKLLRKQAIIPTLDKKPAPGVKDYNKGVPLDRLYKADGIGVINGPLSGICTYDLDSKSLVPPAPFNVESKKGGHIYVPWSDQARSIGAADHVDVLGRGGYSVFHSPNHSFKHSLFADPAVMQSWLDSLSASPLMKRVATENGDRVSAESVDREC
jgi:hypothetical protein